MKSASKVDYFLEVAQQVVQQIVNLKVAGSYPAFRAIHTQPRIINLTQFAFYDNCDTSNMENTT